MKKIALIVGHSMTDKGAINKSTGVQEFDFNEPLAVEVADLLAKAFYKPMIVYRDTYAGLPEKVNETEADIAISFHCNAFNGRPNGTEVLHYHKSTKSKRLAQIFLDKITDCLGLRDRGLRPVDAAHVGSAGDKGGHLCKYTNMPCVIVEPFFIDSDSSLDLATEKFHELALAYYEAIVEYFYDQA